MSWYTIVTRTNLELEEMEELIDEFFIKYEQTPLLNEIKQVLKSKIKEEYHEVVLE